MSPTTSVPEFKVLAVASHVVYGYVGNKMASFCLQALGCDVSALNTVHFSNHTGYRQFKGTKSSAEEIRDIYEGLKQSHLTDFDVMLSGYAPGAEAVEAVGSIARDLKFKATMRPGSFFWVLDPVMGDQGRLYVSEDVVPKYKALLPDADLILPNQFEAEILAEKDITSLSSLHSAISELHTHRRVPNVVITSVRLPSPTASSFNADSTPNPSTQPGLPGAFDSIESAIPGFPDWDGPTLSVVGSTATAAGTPRAFMITVPDLDCFFSGTGDMFAGLLVARLREALHEGDPEWLKLPSWVVPDEVAAVDLPLAKAVRKVLESMHEVLVRTKESAQGDMQSWEDSVKGRRYSNDVEEEGVAVVKDEDADAEAQREGAEKERWLRKTKALEVRVVRNVGLLRGEGVEASFRIAELLPGE